MPSVKLFDMKSKEIGKVDLSDPVFGGEVKPHLIHDVVRYQISRRYENKTANSLTRTEAHGTTRKMYRQKGTGQARHGAETAPQFVGGGKAHGPRPHQAKRRLNKKVRRSALISALSMNQAEERLFVVDKMVLEKTSTKAGRQFLAAFGLETALIINGENSDAERAFNHSLRNVPKVKCLRPEGVNVFDILKFKNLLVSKEAVQKIEERLSHV